MRAGKMNVSEKILFEKLKGSDEAAFKVIYNKYVPRLYYFILEYNPQSDIAENIVQDTLMVLWDKRSTLTDNTNLSAYLFAVAKNNCLYKLRDVRYRTKMYDSTDFSELEMKVNYDALMSLDTSDLTFSEIEKIIKVTLDQLPPQCRKVFNLSRFGDRKYKEIANELNISTKAVEGHISKALKLFRENLKEFLPLMAFLFIK